MLQSNLELYLTYRFAHLLELALNNILWLGVAWYGWHLWSIARRELAGVSAGERVVRRGPLVKHMVTKWVRLLILCVVLFLAHDYWREVEMRRSAHDCKVKSDGRYLGEECQVDGGGDLNILGEGIKYMGLIRVYDAKTGGLLAREFVPMPDRDIHFESGELSQRGVNEDGVTSVSIRLPPTVWDRFKAWMP